MIDDTVLSSYLDLLPAIYREPAGGGRPDFLGRFLLAFERVLTGLGDPEHPGLEEILEGIADPATGTLLLAGTERYFDPGAGKPEAQRAPAGFLEWLAGWVALTLREDWTEEERRRILAEIVPSYKRRGTKEGLRQVLSAYTGLPAASVTITEGDPAAGGPAHYFRVDVLITSGIADLERKRSVLAAIVDAEKPAHTYYDLHLQIATMRIAVRSTIGLDTLLGDPIDAAVSL
jgi:phage tail-like protein